MKQGFTLIELLVVVLIIGILSAVALPQYQDAVSKSRLSRWLVLGKALSASQELCYLANGVYCSTFDEMDISLPAGTELFNTALDGGAGQRAFFNRTTGSSNQSMSGERVRVDLRPGDAAEGGVISMQVDFTDDNEMWLVFYPKQYRIPQAAGRIVCKGNGRSLKLCAKMAGGESKRTSSTASQYFLD